MSRFPLVLVTCSSLLLLGGCAHRMMLPPQIYQAECRDPFAGLDPARQTGFIDVLYATDRIPEEGSAGYGSGRSRSMAFGTARIDVGPGLEWDEVRAYSRSESGVGRPRLRLAEFEEISRFPETPYVLGPGETEWQLPEEKGRDQVIGPIEELIRERLAQTPRKEVTFFVHGVNTSFQRSLFESAEAWHFLGREGVPIAYSWPARSGSLGFSYLYDRESGEFTIFHLKQLLKGIASMPEVEEINLVAHSRGTDIVLTALRELVLELRPEPMPKLGRITLLAADLDLDVTSQRFAAEQLGKETDGIALYVYGGDDALAASRRLLGSRSRVGNLDPKELEEHELRVLDYLANVEVLIFRGGASGAFGHFYWRESPAVSSDLVLWQRYALEAGDPKQRPLKPVETRVWEVDADLLPELDCQAGAP